ncbi:MAG: N-acetyl sugar amidotransferase [Bacteroidales bacterium]|nr:N-acetyl sugar amidotransferase [Bacteroidales bacterium]
MNKKIKICSYCVCDTTISGIKFNIEGRCNYCISHEKFLNKIYYNRGKTHTYLIKILNLIKKRGKDKKYNCIIGASGGVDSSYLLYLAKKWELRPLVVHMNNGWNTEFSVANLINLTNILKFDFYEYYLDFEEFKDLQISFLKASVSDLENPTDMAILGVLHKIAKKHNVKYILMANNFVSEGILPQYFLYNPKDKKYIKSIHRKYGNLKIKKFPWFGLKEELYYKFIKGIKIIYPLNYISYSPEEAKIELKKVFNFIDYPKKHTESIYTKFAQFYYLYKKFNIDYRKATLSSLICSGEITRSEALKILETPPLTLEEEESLINKVAFNFGITKEYLNELINQKPKYFHNYPNNELILKIIYFLFNKLLKKIISPYSL